MKYRLVILATVLLSLGAAGSARADVVLNEVNCEGTDWIELVNTSGTAADLEGWLLTDDPVNRVPPRDDHRYFFPAGAEIAANGVLVIERGASGFPFGVGCGDDTIRLADEVSAIVDETTLEDLTVPADTWGRYPNGTGPWMQTLSTKGGPNQPSPDGGDPPDPAWLYDPGAVLEVNLTAPQSSLDALGVDPHTYVPGTFSLTTTGGTYGPLDVGLRLKGGLVAEPLSGKASFKVKFNEFVAGQRFLGLKKLTLNSMRQDESMIAEVLTYRVFREAGIPAPRTGYAWVRLNDADYGLYVNVEQPDDVFLERWYPTTQHLYEGQYGNDVTRGRAGDFEIDEGSEDDRSDLEEMIEAVQGSWPDWSDGVSPYVDLEQMTRTWAIEKYVGFVDGYTDGGPPYKPNNYFLHSDDAGLFTMLPWGADYTWVETRPFDEPGGTLFRNCLEDESCNAMYRQELAGLPALVAPLNLDELAVHTSELLVPWQEEDPRRPYSMEQIAGAVERTRAFIAARPGEVEAWLNESEPTDAPRTAPGTTITAHPRARARARNVRFAFVSTEAEGTFACRIDKGSFTPCQSPFRTRVGTGRHRFQVRATGLAGLSDPTPAEVRFEVLPPKRR